jgi:hypothetical protein
MPSIVLIFSFQYCGQTVVLGRVGMWETVGSYPQWFIAAAKTWVQSHDLSQTTHVLYKALSTQKSTFLQSRLGVYTHCAQGLLKKLLFIYR